MKKFTRILSLVLVALTILSSTAIFASAADNVVEISENWKEMGAKYSSATRLVLKEQDRITTKFQDYSFTRGENGNIEVDIPDYSVFKGIIPVGAVSSTAITPLDNLEVTMSPADESVATIFKTNPSLYSSYYNMIWSVEPIDYIADESADAGYTGVGHADGAQFDGLRDLVPEGTLGMGVYVTNTHADYSGTGIASTVAVLGFDGSFDDTHDGYGLRWWFRSRNYTDHSGWVDSSGITQTYEAIETTEGLTIKVRPDDTLGYVVVINGKEYYKGTDVAYFPNNTKITEVDGGQNDYLDLAESWTTSMGYAKNDIDFSYLVGLEGGYLTLGLVGGDLTEGTDLYNFSIDTINGIPADDWNGEPNEHTHVAGEWKKLSEPNCAVPGISVLNCTECGAVLEQDLAECTSEHVLMEDWQIVSLPSANNVGRQMKTCIYHTDYVSESQTNPFTDVSFGKWYTDGILYCYANSYMTGTSETTFDYKATMDRQMFATVLAKIDGADLSAYTSAPFDDVDDGKWYTAAIAWAAENEYASGIGEGLYGRKNPVTREQLALFFYTYASKNGVDVSKTADLSKYEDLDRVHDWALDAMGWAVETGLVSGTSETTLAPRASATRAEVSLMAKNFVENVLEPAVGCTVTFLAGEGAVCDVVSVVVPHGTAIGTLPETTNEGYTFDGWCYINAGGQLTRADENTIITNNTVMAASWMLGNKVTLDPNGGALLRVLYGYTPEGDNLYKFVVDGNTMGKIPVPTKEGYNFHGWYYNDTRITEKSIINYSTDITLTAKWEVAPGQAPKLETPVDPETPAE